MASAMTQQHRGRAILQLAAVLLLASPAAMLAAAGDCDSEMFPAGKTYATCVDLPALGAALHWTYDSSATSLSLAFIAKPAATAGWVAWGINPTGDGMKGAQALIAFKSGSTYVVNTYNLTGYAPLGAASTPIAFEATELAADEGADGKVRLYGKLQLPEGMETVNHIWQVGSALAPSGGPAKHAFAQENLDAKGSLALAGAGAPESAPAPVAGGPSIDSRNAETQTASSPSPSSGKPSPSPSAAATGRYASAPVLVVLLALAGFLAIV